MKTPGTASTLQHMARRAQDILARSAADDGRTDERHAAWEEALEHLSQDGEPETAEQAEISEFLELLAASSVTTPSKKTATATGTARPKATARAQRRRGRPSTPPADTGRVFTLQRLLIPDRPPVIWPD
ncbi:hypothetical protein HFP43_00435 [Streptomyces sp. SJ1-7]|nr:hypothetical protein [Streptomyces sp. SJ1-7]